MQNLMICEMLYFKVKKKKKTVTRATISLALIISNDRTVRMKILIKDLHEFFNLLAEIQPICKTQEEKNPEPKTMY